MHKTERYQWAKAGDKGRSARLPVDDLKIDCAYQRDEVSERNTLKIAAAFSWVAFGTLIVMQRSDGSMFIVDGQQRWMAAKKRGESTVPCLVFASDGPDHEAKAFLDLNTSRVKVSAVDKFNAASRAGIEPEAIIDRWLSSIGLRVTNDGKANDGICFPAVLLDSWKMESETAKKAINIQREIIGLETLHSDIHKGLCWLLWNDIDVAAETKRLAEMGGKTAILRSIKALEVELVQRASYRICGIGILKLINHRRRRRIQVPEKD